jgi:predicted Zn-dependent protease
MSLEKSEELVKLAVNALQAGKLEECLELARQAVDEEPRNSHAHQILGVALAKSGKADEATEALRRGVQTNPYDPSAYYNLALHYYNLGDKPAAMAMCQEAIRCDAKHARSIELLKKIEAETHVEVAPYLTSLGDRRSAYRYKEERKEGELSEPPPPPAPPPTNPGAS